MKQRKKGNVDIKFKEKIHLLERENEQSRQGWDRGMVGDER